MFDVGALLVSFIAAFVIVQSSDQQSDSIVSRSSLGYEIALIGLVFNPLLLASGQIAMRKMVNIHHFVVSSYLNVSVGLAGVLMTWILGDSFFGAARQFTMFSWILISLCSGLVMVAQTAKFLAL